MGVVAHALVGDVGPECVAGAPEAAVRRAPGRRCRRACGRGRSRRTRRWTRLSAPALKTSPTGRAVVEDSVSAWSATRGDRAPDAHRRVRAPQAGEDREHALVAGRRRQCGGGRRRAGARERVVQRFDLALGVLGRERRARRDRAAGAPSPARCRRSRWACGSGDGRHRRRTAAGRSGRVSRAPCRRPGPCPREAGTRRRGRRARGAEPLWGGRSCALRHASARSVTKPAVTCLTAAIHLLIMPGSHSPGGRGSRRSRCPSGPAEGANRTRLPMRRRSSLFAAVAGPRAKWIVFGVWFVVDLRVVRRRRAREVHGRPGERVDVVPARRRRVDQGADRRRGPAGRRARPGGHPLPPRERADRGRQGRRSSTTSGGSPQRRFEGVVRRRRDRRRGRRRAAARPSGAAADRGLRRPDHADPRPAERLRAVRRPGVLAGRQGRAGLRLRPRRRRGRDAAGPGRSSGARRSRDPGGGLEVKITGGAGYAADAIEVFENINGTLLLRGDAAGDRAADPDLPVADLPLHPARRR